MDWYLVSSQLYFTINLEEIFYFNNKKCRIYAVFGVSQTPKYIVVEKEKRSMSSILVLGGAGYIGSHTVYELIAVGENVVVVDNLETGFRKAVHQDAYE